MNERFDPVQVHGLRAQGLTWDEVAERVGALSGGQVKDWYNKRGKRHVDEAHDQPGMVSQTATLSKTDIARITSLDDLLAFFAVDTERWEVASYRVNKSEVYSKQDGVMPLYHVRAVLKPLAVESVLTPTLYRELTEDMTAASEHIQHAPVPPPTHQGEHLFVLGIMDPHLGMLAWREETGNNYDLGTAFRDYTRAAESLLSLHSLYGAVEEVVVVVGNDLMHIDTMLQGKIGATTAGTPQDFDSRYAKIFRTARRAVVSVIDQARQIAPVRVVMVEGNHDRNSTYVLGEVLSAWYRADDRVTVAGDPTSRKYHRYGANLLGLTHGDLVTDPKALPLIMATEAAVDWSATTYREWITGHIHASKRLRVLTEMTEDRGVRVSYLPGLTAIDKWHDDQGYNHLRAATAMIYNRNGGRVGLHEVYPT